MADAISAYKEAFSSYRKNIVDYIIYSLIAGIIEAGLFAILLVMLFVLGIVSAGGIVSISSTGNIFSFEALGFGATTLVLLAGFLIFLLVQGGIAGAYIKTIALLLSGQKQSLGGFFSLLPHFAAKMLVIYLVIGIFVSIPTIAGFALAYFLGWGLIGAAVVILAVFLSLLVSVFFVYAMPIAVVDGRGAVDSVKISIVRVIRNPVAAMIYMVVSGILCLPMIIPVVNALYASFVLMPITQSALIVLCKHTH